MERILRTRLVTGLVLVVVFGAGMVLGLALDRSLAAEPAAEVARARGSAGDSTRSHRRTLFEQVGVTDAQKAQIDSIVGNYRSAMRALHAEFRAAYNPRYEALVSETRAAIKGVMTPEQGQAYDSLVAEYDRRRAERSSRDNRE